MSNTVFHTPSRIEIESNDKKSIYGTFWVLHCEGHGDTLCFTDESGSDYCIKCLEHMLKKDKS